MKLHPLLNAAVAADYAQTLARRGGFQIVYDPTVDTAYTATDNSGKSVIVVPPWNEKLGPQALAFTLYMIVHEVAHHEHGAHMFEIQARENLDMHSLLGGVYNMVEDVRIENAGSQTYAGDARTMREGLLAFLKWKIPLLGPIMPCTDDFQRKYQGLQSTALMSRLFVDRRHIIEADNLARKKGYKREWIKMTDKYKNRLITLPLENVTGTEASWELAKEIVKAEFDPHHSDPKNWKLPKRKKVKGQGEGKGEGGKNKGEGGKDDGDGEAEGKAKDGKGKDAGVLIVSNHAEKDAKPKPNEFNNKIINTGEGAHTYNPKAVCINRPTPQSGEDTTSSQARKYANKLRNLIQAETYPMWLRGLDKGRRLASTRLYRVGMPTHDPDHKKIWQRKVERINPTLDTAVSIIVDLSRSMCETMQCGTQMITTAADIAGALDHALRNILHINVEVLGYTVNYRGIYISEVSTFGQKVRKGQIAATLTDEFYSKSGTTPTGMAMLVAMKRLLQHGARRKIVLCITDGSPYSGSPGQRLIGDSMAQSMAAKKACDSMEEFDMFGVCLQGMVNSPKLQRAWKKVFGKDHVVVTTHATAVSETFRGLIKLLMRR